MASWLAGEAQKFVDQTQEYVTCLINGPATTESESQTEIDAAPAYATDKSWWLANPALGVVGSELWVPMQTVPPTTVECAPVAGSPAQLQMVDPRAQFAYFHLEQLCVLS